MTVILPAFNKGQDMVGIAKSLQNVDLVKLALPVLGSRISMAGLLDRKHSFWVGAFRRRSRRRMGEQGVVRTWVVRRRGRSCRDSIHLRKLASPN
jgi:hypothetical protein